MSKEWRNNCCSCATESYPCIGDACQYRHVPYLICDDCGTDYEDRLYILDGQEVCADCVESNLPQRHNDEYDDTEFLYDGEWLPIDEVLELLPTVTIDDMLWEGEF